jgi:hypothetical protein
MRERGDHYEYLAVYVDDVIASKDPAIIDELTTTHKFVEGNWTNTYHPASIFAMQMVHCVPPLFENIEKM